MTPHFTKGELACRDGCGMLPAQDFMDKIERLRLRCGFPMPVTSAARCPKHNQRVSKSGPNGPHTTGRAIDLGVDGPRAYELVRIAIEMGFTGIGIHQRGTGRFVHVDDLPNKDHPRPRIWSY